MRGRCHKLFCILLLCLFMGSCDKYTGQDELKVQDNNRNIIKEINQKGDVNVVEKKDIQEEHLDGKELNKKYRDYPAGTEIDIEELNQESLKSLFYMEELNQEIINRINGKSYKENCDIPYSDLRYIRVLHIGFDGLTHIGEMIVNKAIAQDVIDIFWELYSISYPIEKMLLIDDYNADDLESMKDNNSSAFNFRFIEGTSKRSVHSDGLAIDINPLYNPYVRTREGKLEILPENAEEYVDRSIDNIYYIRKDDPCYEAFIKRGFTWGGEWKNSKDYQHFEKKIGD
ncbi:M15 family metallopeptidase [Herbinix luporum]|uniref:Putative secreted protein n=1 Tax=Herbinix luporum TaxID=1679721 RepID=A0A0K8J2F1_9FIRM|nr:M15 family metallopeptidase [Herbinix luporum]CUH91635.1 putative secreted protein [Herbinix luporum]